MMPIPQELPSPMESADADFGKVVAVHVGDSEIDEIGMVDILKINPIAKDWIFLCSESSC